MLTIDRDQRTVLSLTTETEFMFQLAYLFLWTMDPEPHRIAGRWETGELDALIEFILSE